MYSNRRSYASNEVPISLWGLDVTFAAAFQSSHCLLLIRLVPILTGRPGDISLSFTLSLSLFLPLSAHSVSLSSSSTNLREEEERITPSTPSTRSPTSPPKMTPLYPLLTPLLLLTHQSLAAPNDQYQHQQQKPPHVTARAIQAARRNSAKITSPPLPLSFSSSSSTSAPPPSCPTTLTVENRPGCGGCTTTEYATTLTQSVDCGGGGDGEGERCESLVTSTLYHRAFGICPVSFFPLFFLLSVCIFFFLV